MRVAWLEIRNFRSIRALRLEGLDKPHIILEGPNDVGKSNILQALDLAFHWLPLLLRKRAGLASPLPGEPRGNPEWLRQLEGLYRVGEEQFTMGLGIRFDVQDARQNWHPSPGQVVEYRLSWTRASLEPELGATTDHRGDLSGMAWALAPAFRFITTQRTPHEEQLQLNSGTPLEYKIRWEGNNLKQLLFLYKNSPDLDVQERFEQLRASLRESDLGIGLINVSVQPNQQINVRTRHEGLELDIEERGSGVQQLLTLLALSMCHRGRVLAIEEPEMNLSEPNQRLLWRKLREFAGPSGPLDQVFITSHSRVFEEEAERLVVSKDPREGTLARWAEPLPTPRVVEEAALPVTRGGGVTLPEDVLEHLGIQAGKHVYLVPREHGYHLLGPQGYADHLREEG